MTFISYAQNFEDVMLWRALKHIDNGFYVDVGANHPEHDSVTKAFYDAGWHGINIEPLAVHYQELRKQRPRDNNLPLAVGEQAGQFQLWQCGIRGWATLDTEVARIHEAKGHKGSWTTVEVQPLSVILEQHAPADIHFLKIDVEGFEKSVLQSMDFSAVRPWIVVVEATIPDSKEENYATWEHLLTGADYLLAYTDGLNRFYVAEEQSELIPSFQYPPNVFDGFKLNAQNLAEVETQQAEARTRQAEARAEQAETVSSQYLRQLDDLYQSSSWRLTKPWRWLGNQAKLLRQHGLKQCVSALLVKKRDTLKAEADEHVQHTYSAAVIPENLQGVSPHVRKLYTGLQRAIAQYQGSQPDPDESRFTTQPDYDAVVSLCQAQLENQINTAPDVSQNTARPRLALVSPMPPARTGIANYSAELLPALAHYYDIEIVVAQPEVSGCEALQGMTPRTVDWLRQNINSIDRVLYHIGNSSFHLYMLDVLQEIPGTVVLHDFFISGLVSALEFEAGHAHALSQMLYADHGYRAVADRYKDIASARMTYPVNFHVLNNANGIIVHSEYSKRLADQWYAFDYGRHFAKIPHLRDSSLVHADKTRTRQALGIAEDAFVICSFGFLGETKLNDRLLGCWASSQLFRDQNCQLIFVGENHSGKYGQQLLARIETLGCQQRVSITGFVENDLYQQYLVAADVAVQLRTCSRGETSGTVLDCMNHGLPLVVNANGSMAELDATAVCMLPDDFADQQLIKALETLWADAPLRQEMGRKSRCIIQQQHSPAGCAHLYAAAIESFYQQAQSASAALLPVLAQHCSHYTDKQLIELSTAVAAALPESRPAKTLYLDITATCSNDLKTGIERVARAQVLALVQDPPPGYRVEPVYLEQRQKQWVYRHASRYVLELLGCPADGFIDEIAQPQSGDLLLGLDISGDKLVQAQRSGLHQRYRDQGVRVYYMVFDLLPLQLPEVFPPASEDAFSQWLSAATSFDGAITISQAVARDLQAWLQQRGQGADAVQPLDIHWLHLGADLANSSPSTGLPSKAKQTLKQLQDRPTMLMVGTIEPRKGYLQAIQAFDMLWAAGLDINLVIVGREGWQGLDDALRRDIPETTRRLRHHPEADQRLFWLEGISDQYLEEVYAASTCLLAASYGEGFGLPLIEAAQHKLPILARDIPVFREVLAEHASYFTAAEPQQLAQAVTDWLTLYQQGQHPSSEHLPWLTWQQSAHNLVNILLK